MYLCKSHSSVKSYHNKVALEVPISTIFAMMALFFVKLQLRKLFSDFLFKTERDY